MDCEKVLRKSIVLLLTIGLFGPVIPVLAQPPDRYRTENEVLEDFFDLYSSHSDVMMYEVIGQTVEGKEIYLFKLGNPQGIKVFIDASIHGHEYITTEALYYCIEWILTERTDLLETNYVLFVPIINRDCYRIRRTNAVDVDLNRNFPTYWQPTGYGTIYYSGPEPLSEPETTAIHNVLAQYHPRWYINLHAGYEETRITPPSFQSIYDDVYAKIQDTSRTLFGVDPFPYDTYQFYEGMARYEGEAQGAYTWEIEISECNPSTDYFFKKVIPRLQAVFLETFLEGVSEPDPTSNNPPVANVNGPYVGFEDTLITFSAAGSTDLDDDPLSYIWDFGDGNTAETTSESVTHTYDNGLAGQTATYSVRLIVNDGQIDSQESETTATITGVNDAPVANANGPYSGVINEDVLFDAAGSYDEEEISTYSWDFGDGNLGIGSTAVHQYTSPGTYVVQLTVTDTDGMTDVESTVAEITDATPNPNAVIAIDMLRKDSVRGRGVSVSRAQAAVSVKVENSPLKGAMVYGSWSGAVDKIVIGSTNGEGKVTFRTEFVKDADLFTLTVIDVEKDRVTYNLQGEISASI